MVCPNCGNANVGDSKFCSLCGTRLDLNNASETASTQSIQEPVVIPPVYDARPARDQSPLSVGQFVLMDFLMILPIANIVLLFVWAFGSSENENRRNWARAKLIWVLIALGITIVLVILLFTIGLGTIRYVSDVIERIY